MDSDDFDKKRYIKELENPFVPQTLQEIKNEVKLPLSDSQIDKFFGFSNFNNHIIKFSELSKYKDLDSLFSKTGSGYKNRFFGWKIILEEFQLNNGHWVAILKYKKRGVMTYLWFDSYGKPPGFLIGSNSVEENNELGQTKNFIINLMQKKADENPNVNVLYNSFQFQTESPEINTCGRWVLMMILMCDHFNFGIEDFGKLILYLQKVKYKNKLSLDEIVTLLVDISFDF